VTDLKVQEFYLKNFKMRKPTITLCPLFIIVTGLGFFAMFIILGFGGLEAVIEYAITKVRKKSIFFLNFLILFKINIATG